MHKGLSILMITAILAITGFQVFWLAKNFEKEKRNLELRSNFFFNETIRRLQAKKLNLDKIMHDTSGRIRMEVFDGLPPGQQRTVNMNDGELAGVLNDITIKVKDSADQYIFPAAKPADLMIQTMITRDSAESKRFKNNGVVISMTESHIEKAGDSAREFNFQQKGRPGELIRFLYSVDSLQDSLRVKEIDSACRKTFAEEGLNIPFTILQYDTVKNIRRFPSENPGERNKVTLGFSHPVTYELKTGNSFMFIARKLASPVLFSVFLVGITVISFVLLYRNLVKQKRLTEIKNEFIGNITHELKTPIATVGVAIEALQNFNAINDPQRTREYLDISQNELQRLSLLVDKVLKLSMFEKKEIELKYEPLDLKDVVNEVVSSMRLQIEKYHAHIEINTEGDTSLQGDRLHLLSVVFNLLDNALKYGNGNTAVKIEVKEKEKEVELSFADNGIGIAKEYQDKVFEKFFRVPSGDRHNTKGYGLGLSYVAHVIQKHRGKIDVESRPGAGTKFIISLPKNA